MIRIAHIIAAFLLAIPTISIFIEVEDLQNQRKGRILGDIEIRHFQRDNKPAMMIYGALMQDDVGEPSLRLSDIDIIHEIQENVYRFQPEVMQPTQLEGNIEHIETVTFKSKKRAGWLYHFRFSQLMKNTMVQIIDFVNMHQIQPHIDLFQNLPHDLKEKLMLEQEQAVRALQKKTPSFHQHQNNDDL